MFLAAGETVEYRLTLVFKEGELCNKHDCWYLTPCMWFYSIKNGKQQSVYLRFTVEEDTFLIGAKMDIGDIYLNGEPAIIYSGNKSYLGTGRSNNPSLSLSTIAYAYHSQIASLAYINDSSEIIGVLSWIYKRLNVFLQPPLTQEYINSFMLRMPMKSANK
jgi:hypothetical protein